MVLVLDTSILIDIEKRNEKTISKLKELSKQHPFPPQITFINHFEFLFGLKLKQPANKKEMLIFLNKFNVLQPTTITSEILSDLKIKYEKQGITLSLTDLLIASQTIEHNMILATKDKDFTKIKELKAIIL